MRPYNTYLLFLLMCIVAAPKLTAQNKSNKGKEFWLGYGHNILFTQGNPANGQTHVLYLSAEQAATVTVSINGTGWSQTVSIPANTVDYSVVVPKSGTDDARLLNEGLSAKGIHIVSDVPIVAYSHQHGITSSGATMLMPVETFGYTYYSLNFTQVSNMTDCYSWFYVVAAENNTRIQITPSDSTQGGWEPGITYTVNLNKGEIYNVFGKTTGSLTGKDLTGSKIVSVSGNDGNCHPVAVFSGSSRNVVCTGGNNGGEVMQQQIFPAIAWGTRYLTYHHVNNTSGDIVSPFLSFYRVAVRNPATVVKRNGVAITGLINNFYYEFTSGGGDYIEADQPVLVAQYTTSSNECSGQVNPPVGDPEMIYLSPVEQGVRNAYFYSTRNQAIDYNFINIIVPQGGLSSLRIDGNAPDPAEYITHPANSNYTVVVKRLTGAAAQHHVSSDSSFIATAYGLGYFESYGYNMGTMVNNLNAHSEIKNTLNTNNRPDTFTCPKTPVRLYIKLAYPATAVHWKLSQVNGIVPNTDSVISNPIPVNTSQINGRTYYTYTLQQDFSFNSPGTYYIPVSYTSPDIDACNNTETASITVLVKPGPPADFSTNGILCLKDSVQFTGATSAVNGLFNYTGYLWNFDDGSTQSTINAKKKFSAEGNHDVRYRVYADNGCIGETTKTISLQAGPALSITVSGKPCTDSIITFTSSVIPNAGNPATWWWDFGDTQTGFSSSSNIITHQFATAQINISIRHMVTFATGCNPDTATYSLPAVNNNPAAAFTITADTLCPNKPVRFTSATSTANIWNWNFGNGTGQQTPPFIYKYANAGSYDVTLTVTDNNGCGSAPHTEHIDIMPAPLVNAGPDKFVSIGSATALEATITNPANYIYQWSPASYLSDATALNPTVTPSNDPITFIITATDKISLCSASDAVVITPVSKLFVPTGFTPNNDGKNDTWIIPGLALYPDALVTVYSRWGGKLFESKGSTTFAWNGKYKGLILPAGVYVYQIELNDINKQRLKGTVAIIY